MSEDRGFGLRTFRVQGLSGLEETELDSTRLLAVLRGPFDTRKATVLEALALFRFLVVQWDNTLGPPLGGLLLPVSINPDELNSNKKTPIIFDAEVAVTPGDFDKVGRRPAALQLDRFRVALKLTWHGGEAHYTMSRFDNGTGRDFGKTRDYSEIGDIAFATELCYLAVDILLASARSSDSSTDIQTQDQSLNKREQEVLDIVGKFQLDHGECAPIAEVVLSFPHEDAQAADAAVQLLIKKAYLHRSVDSLTLTPAGLLACSFAGEAAAFARRLIDYLRFRAEQERARFTNFTSDELKLANVIGAEEDAFARAIIAILRITESHLQWGGVGEQLVWMCPGDMASLRAISDIHGLRCRAERIYKEEAAAAKAVRQSVVMDQETGARAMGPSGIDGVKPMKEDKVIAMRRELLRNFYDKYMASPTAQIGWDRDESDPDSTIRIREAKWLHEHGLIVATFGAAGDFMARLTVKGRDFVDAGGFDRKNSSTESNQHLTEGLPMQKPRIFIGSSVEGLTIAENVQLGLDHQAECTLWSQGVFGLSGGTLESLLRAVKGYEFAVLILTPDDLVHKRETTKNSPRDNVLFELGLFMGALGRERTYIVYCRDEKPDLPSDLAGVTAATYAKRSDGNLHAAVGPVCTQIKTAINAVKAIKTNP